MRWAWRFRRVADRAASRVESSRSQDRIFLLKRREDDRRAAFRVREPRWSLRRMLDFPSDFSRAGAQTEFAVDDLKAREGCGLHFRACCGRNASGDKIRKKWQYSIGTRSRQEE